MTILFQQDWTDAYGRQLAVPHWETKNTSAWYLSRLLERMNVKNNMFHLALHDTELAKHDPHNLTDPSIELRQRIALECTRNVWYYLREVIRVPASGGDPISFEFHRGNLAMTWCYYNNIDFTSTQPRQTGKTIGAICITSHIMYFFGRYIKMAMLTKDAKLVQENVARLKDIRKSLPDYLLNESKDDEDNKFGLSYTQFDNHYKTYIGQADKAGADNLGRGMTSPTIHIDEIGYTVNIDITFPVLLASTTRARENAMRNGQPHSNLYTTTAARTDTKAGRYAFEIVNNAMPFTERLYDCTDVEDAKRIISANSANNIVNGTFSYLMLGRSHEWFHETTRRLNATREVIRRDFLNIWESGSEQALLRDEDLARLNANRREPTHIQIMQDYTINWYLPRAIVEDADFRKKPFVLGMDCSELVNRDFTTFAMVDPKDLSLVATFRCNESNLTKLKLFIGEFLMMFPNTVFVPERKSTAVSLIDDVATLMVQHGQNPFYRIFNKVVEDREEEAMKRIDLSDTRLAERVERKYLGFMTTSASRTVLYKNTLQKAVGMNAERIWDATLIRELSCLTTKNGRVDHADGEHDDMVIAYLLACWFIYEAKNKHMYGLRPEHLMSAITAAGVGIDPTYMQAQLELRRQIKKFETLIANTDDDTIKVTFRQRVNELSQYVDTKMAINPITTDGMRRDLNTYGNIFGGSIGNNARPVDRNMLMGLARL